uniref:Uncharacterized protein n=1 Tax=Chromera velia CCMP2878 TaxID=1169474 RepID=A0A0G4HXP3_9ALVE|eukprot:Cvel_9310.t1-p1 / transcript=Cvel_9310.t1 / gene=Cvel_9310 / organism=Chromera_velia_CCMP2878 / gene_product=hypothetical protein / transcript_product=hypothetical protein / location=Cvel_scaffold533:59261-63200(-) / protein_length=831 / sequence_SO=supercontig / SO=protein_coding / is_pseudo=false
MTETGGGAAPNSSTFPAWVEEIRNLIVNKWPKHGRRGIRVVEAIDPSWVPPPPPVLESFLKKPKGGQGKDKEEKKGRRGIGRGKQRTEAQTSSEETPKEQHGHGGESQGAEEKEGGDLGEPEHAAATVESVEEEGSDSDRRKEESRGSDQHSSSSSRGENTFPSQELTQTEGEGAGEGGIGTERATPESGDLLTESGQKSTSGQAEGGDGGESKQKEDIVTEAEGVKEGASPETERGDSKAESEEKVAEENDASEGKEDKEAEEEKKKRKLSVCLGVAPKGHCSYLLGFTSPHLSTYTAFIKNDTKYLLAHSEFFARIDVPTGYPAQPPLMTFLSSIHHPVLKKNFAPHATDGDTIESISDKVARSLLYVHWRVMCRFPRLSRAEGPSVGLDPVFPDDPPLSELAFLQTEHRPPYPSPIPSSCSQTRPNAGLRAATPLMYTGGDLTGRRDRDRDGASSGSMSRGMPGPDASGQSPRSQRMRPHTSVRSPALEPQRGSGDPSVLLHGDPLSLSPTSAIPALPQGSSSVFFAKEGGKLNFADVIAAAKEASANVDRPNTSSSGNSSAGSPLSPLSDHLNPNLSFLQKGPPHWESAELRRLTRTSRVMGDWSSQMFQDRQLGSELRLVRLMSLKVKEGFESSHLQEEDAFLPDSLKPLSQRKRYADPHLLPMGERIRALLAKDRQARGSVSVSTEGEEKGGDGAFMKAVLSQQGGGQDVGDWRPPEKAEVGGLEGPGFLFGLPDPPPTPTAAPRMGAVSLGRVRRDKASEILRRAMKKSKRSRTKLFQPTQPRDFFQLHQNNVPCWQEELEDKLQIPAFAEARQLQALFKERHG